MNKINNTRRVFLGRIAKTFAALIGVIFAPARKIFAAERLWAVESLSDDDRVSGPRMKIAAAPKKKATKKKATKKATKKKAKKKATKKKAKKKKSVKKPKK